MARRVALCGGVCLFDAALFSLEERRGEEKDCPDNRERTDRDRTCVREVGVEYKVPVGEKMEKRDG